MTTHLEFELDDLNTTLSQDITIIRDRRVTAVAPKLHFFNNPAGTFTITVKRGAATVGSKSMTMAEINTLVAAQEGVAEDYKVGYFSFIFNGPIRLSKNITYTLILSTSGYTFSGASSVAWVKEYLNATNQIEAAPTPENDLWLPFSYRLWEI